ncbi:MULTISPECIES: hypothetical protein [unclassified Microbacterium]|uniref:hypothetical protein n=2 Tax=Microbacterium TaxID=33882 RepID=UPI0006F1FDD3|nr:MULTISPECIES: hypothetical protein [unclassified Microbacterium]AOX46160.1 hypothetical protein BJP65_10350 [Microbacterium sp. BH-3-3-3]KQT75494.1 hypothetical protein ASG45_03075 [Microbacterium sp. Leaf436]MBD8205745.1 hypothetical protein [Microbacterium sp. CFBP 8801]MBD8217662.1 hypothetical protein [Microbacterium sp. CFBP 13617]MBD8476819.1 hypothetical protein [Microbacterium sp. CFBP 8794]
MVTLLLDSTQLEVVLSPTERAMSFRKTNIVVPREHIERVQLTDDAWTWLRGVPNPGINLPVAVGMGTWKSASGNDFVVIRGRKPSVVVDLTGHDEYERLVLTTKHGVALLRALRLDVASEPEDVADIVR